MSKPRENPVFRASKSDPFRAAEVSDSEYEEHMANLETVVMPCLASAAVALKRAGFSIVKLDRRGGLASLVVRHRPLKVDGWLYFQIHRSFGPLMSGDRIFWMFSVRAHEKLENGKPGRLKDLKAAADVNPIGAEFTGYCMEAIKDKRSIETYPIQSDGGSCDPLKIPVKVQFKSGSNDADLFSLSEPVTEHDRTFCVLYHIVEGEFSEVTRLWCDGEEFKNAQAAADRHLALRSL